MTAKFKSGSRKLPQRFLQQAILKLLRKKSTKFYNAKTIVQKLGVKNSRDSAEDALRTLYSKGKVLSDGRGRYGINPKNAKSDARRSKDLYNGRIEVIPNGAGFVIVEGFEQDVYIPKKYVYGALHGDTVRIESSKPRPGRRPEGKVVDVVTRGRTAYIGIFLSLIHI